MEAKIAEEKHERKGSRMTKKVRRKVKAIIRKQLKKAVYVGDHACAEIVKEQLPSVHVNFAIVRYIRLYHLHSKIRRGRYAKKREKLEEIGEMHKQNGYIKLSEVASILERANALLKGYQVQQKLIES